MLRGASGDSIPGALSISTGAVPDPARGPEYMAPTYFVGFPGSIHQRLSWHRTLNVSINMSLDAKNHIRRLALQRREGLDLAWRQRASHDISEQIVKQLQGRENIVIAGYWPIRSEVDPRPALEILSQKHNIALPVMTGEDLLFRAWKPSDILLEQAFGVYEPKPDQPAVMPDIVLVPVVAVDAKGGRIGYGKGYYDRTLKNLRAIGQVQAIGLAFDVQFEPSLTLEAHDERLDLIITNR
jgi:5-formyltetrahydrofolate cyclo-ligase